VIDAAELAVATTVAMVETLAQPVGVVLVGDISHANSHDSTTLAKWGPFDRLLEAIEKADESRRRTSGGNGGPA
ncbi:MAG: hypothetical protein JWO23_1896, partial [Solirubrobacterales bacterium]|nr:hypothetical protein [Solirubrobacterales bacterium]